MIHEFGSFDDTSRISITWRRVLVVAGEAHTSSVSKEQLCNFDN
jgi:hypothetical protein